MEGRLSRYNLGQQPYTKEKYSLADSLLRFDDDLDSFGKYVDLSLANDINQENSWGFSLIFLTTDVTQTQYILGNWQYPSNPYGIELYIAGSTSTLNIAVGVNSTVFISHPVVSNRLYHVFVCRDNTSKVIKYWINGIKAGTNSSSGITTEINDSTLTWWHDKTFRLGSDVRPDNNRRAFKGNIGALKVFNFGTSVPSDISSSIRRSSRDPYIIPQELHQYCVGEWDLKDDQYSKDNLDEYGVGVDNVVALDTVEGYNYTRQKFIHDDFPNTGAVTYLDGCTENQGVVTYDLPITDGESYTFMIWQLASVEDPLRIQKTRAKISFDITVAFDGDGFGVKGGAYRSFPQTANVSAVGSYVFESDLFGNHIRTGSTFSFIASGNTTKGTIENIKIEINGEIIPAHGVLLGWTEPEVVDTNPTKIVDFYTLELRVPSPTLRLVSAELDQIELGWDDLYDSEVSFEIQEEIDGEWQTVSVLPANQENYTVDI